jgi:hypothetical protein
MWPLPELSLCTTETYLNQDLKIKYLIKKTPMSLRIRVFFIKYFNNKDYRANLRVYFPMQKLTFFILIGF